MSVVKREDNEWVIQKGMWIPEEIWLGKELPLQEKMFTAETDSPEDHAKKSFNIDLTIDIPRHLEQPQDTSFGQKV